MKKLFLILASLVTISSSVSAMAQDTDNNIRAIPQEQHDMNADHGNISNGVNVLPQENRDIRQDRNDIVNDQRQINKERQERDADLRRGDRTAAMREQQEINDQERDIHKDRRDLRHDETQIHRQRQTIDNPNFNPMGAGR